MKLVIIEDEPLVTENLVDIIESLDQDITISKTLASLKEAFNYFKDNEYPDLFISDIQLADGLSFEFFQKEAPQVPVVFCTAYDEYALEAFKVNGIDYLLKPFNDADIANTIKKYYQLLKTGPKDTGHSKIDLLIEHIESTTPKQNKSILIHSGDMIIPIKTEDIRLVYLRNGLVHLRTVQGEKYMSPFTMDKMSVLLQPQAFRVNRQFIIHKDIVNHATHHFGRKLQVHLTIPFEEIILVSKARSSEFLKWLESGN